MSRRSFVGRVDCTGEVLRFPTLAEAEAYVATVLTERDRAGVEAGDYYVDADDDEREREALRREARQEALLDAGPILAEHRRAKGET